MSNRYRDVHILCHAKNKLFIYVYKGKEMYWVTKNKSLSADIKDRAFVSSWDRVEKIIDMLGRHDGL